MKNAVIALFSLVLAVALSACTARHTSPDKTIKNKTDENTSVSSKLESSETVSNSEFISSEQAQTIVFERAGVKKEDVTQLETELDYDDDRKEWEYDIEFNVGKTEYGAEVNAVSGEIVKFDKDRN